MSYTNPNACNGMNGMVAYPGSTVSPSSVVYDVETTAWRWIYLLLIAVVIIAVLALVWWALKKEWKFFGGGKADEFGMYHHHMPGSWDEQPSRTIFASRSAY